MQFKKNIAVHGHRGARGLYPENTIIAFTEAIKLGVDAIELDVVVSKDKKIVVSHEAWMNEIFCSLPSNKKLEGNVKEKFNLYTMDYAEIASFDCGQNGNPEFPHQKKISQSKPLLSKVISTIETYIQKNNLPPVLYNIEIKTEGETGIFNPDPKTFTDLVYQELKSNDIINKSLVQSFDVKILQEMRLKDPDLKIGLLVENSDSTGVNLKRLGFLPDFYNPDFTLLNKEMLAKLKANNIKVIPWTVNEVPDMERLIALGVDGIITDYPDKAIDLIKAIKF